MSNIAYIPMRAKMAYASASQGTNTPRNGTKAARPVHKKNNHIHQPEIVLGNEIFISYSLRKMDFDRRADDSKYDNPPPNQKLRGARGRI